MKYLKTGALTLMLRTGFAAISFAAISPASAQENPRFSHKQWQAACGDVYCTLHSRAQSSFALSRRHNGGPWVLSLDIPSIVGAFDLLIDGALFDLALDTIVPFPKTLINGNVLEARLDDHGFSEGVSLAGFSAAMRWADEYQGMLDGNPTMIYHKTNWQALAEMAAADTSITCDFPEPGRDEAGLLPLIDIPGHPEIKAFGATCWLAAYNVGSNLYLLGPDFEGDAPLAAASRYVHDGEVEPILEIATMFGEGPMTHFKGYSKGRGVGDCFTEETYDFDGFYYMLTKRVQDNDCDGKIIPIQMYPE